MNKLFSFVFVFLLTTHYVVADTVYVDDEQNLTLRNAPSVHAKGLKVLTAGYPLTVIENQNKFDFIKVSTLDGTEGYIKERFTTKKAPSIDPKDAAAKNIAQLQSDNNKLHGEITDLKGKLTPGTPLEKTLANERDQLARELNDLKKTAASAYQLKNERDEFQERVVNAERDLQQFKLENQSLKDTASQDWFLYGGLLALFGVILGFILPKLDWRRKNSWDSF